MTLFAGRLLPCIGALWNSLPIGCFSTPCRRPGPTDCPPSLESRALPNSHLAAAGIGSLVNTGEFRNAHTYVIRRKGR